MLQCGRYRLELAQPALMGIVNLTDDSFSGDGWRDDLRAAIEHGLKLVEEGAGILDLGAESSRPGARSISAAQELARLLPVLDGLKDCGVPLSVDTTKAEVMREAVAAGADMINDIAALEAEGAIAALAGTQVAICLMHKQGVPETMQRDPRYGDVVTEVRGYLEARVDAVTSQGVAAERLSVDPGFGFGKSLAHNIELLRGIGDMRVRGLPVLAGISRKSMLGLMTGREVGERLYAGIAAQLIAARRGARILRVHDVAAMRDALAVWQAVEGWQ